MPDSVPPTFPAVRARTCQDTISYFETYRLGGRALLDARLPPGHIDRIFGYATTALIPLELDAAMGDAVVEILGRDEALRFWTRYVTKHMESPILGGFVRTAVRLLGPTPKAFFKWMPRAMLSIFHNVFDVEVEMLEEGATRLRYDVASDTFLEAPCYDVALDAIARAVFVVTKKPGEVIVRRDLRARTYVVDAHWTA
jgi:hypothetical protein